jgi:hypothetical protein
LLEEDRQEYRQVDWCVEVLRYFLVGDVIVIDDVGHLATAPDILVLVEPELSFISALCANTYH